MHLPEAEEQRRRHSLLRLLPGLLLGMLLSGCSTLERHHEALLVLGDLAAGETPSRLKQRTPPPKRKRLAYAVEGRDYVADLYHPAISPRGTLILVHGLTEAGRRDPRLMALARTLARSGFTVLVPELDGLRDFSVGTREVQRIADAIRYAADALAMSVEGPALAAISFATGPALLAAMQPDTTHRVRFVIAVGGYYDLTDLLRYATTGEDRGSTGRRPPPPQRDVRWAVLRSQLHALEDAQDRERLAAIARRQLAGEEVPEPDASELSPQAMALYELVTNRDPARVTSLLEALPPRLLVQFTALDLASRDLAALEARLVLIHGPDDRVIPISHSRRLRDALPAGQARLFEAEGLGHVEVSSHWRDAWSLWRAIHHVLELSETESEHR
ncbi:MULTISPECIES: alpha/beta hydrolase [unclassified Halomonas]|uniref:alpha/beta hydrolase family protein n=1 Tax=unclassified Halomonas TaxID=2609666 RepID=UPI002888238C|nr:MULTISPECIES: alpha/beta hydrolase [unclassified Halomonas]MDT0499546.1 alpha/beta hydrolase [Halomonas sp. PAR7]MDT0510637.1 alpha/beta hydrolase [Halomonas sp. LES1]MDT0592350.1 alpha/beta hydrolase [Halomonas sp. PAR8]